MAMFNISNHPSMKWSQSQLEAARALGGEIIDLPFPSVPSAASTADVVQMAEQVAAQVTADCGQAMVQGEMCLTLAIVRLLQARGVVCLAACSDRRTVEKVQPDGSTVKTATFEFVQFRAYP